MNVSLQQHLDSLARDECYRVDAVLKEGALERTERVFFVGANGAEQGPYVRKIFDAESGLGAAYGRVLAAQRQGKRFLHLPRIVDCYSLGEQDAVVMEFVSGCTLAYAMPSPNCIPASILRSSIAISSPRTSWWRGIRSW